MEKNLAYYLTHPLEAHEVPEALLKDWEEKYPYSFGVKWIRARKAVVLKSVDAGKRVAQAAAYSGDLPFLYFKLLDREPDPAMATDLVKIRGGRIGHLGLDSSGDTSGDAAQDSGPKPDSQKTEVVEQRVDLLDPPSSEMEEVSKDLEKKSEGTREEDGEMGEKEATVQGPVLEEASMIGEESEREVLVRAVLAGRSKAYSDFTQWLVSLDAGGDDDRVSSDRKKKKKGKKKKHKAKKKSRLEKLISTSIAEKEEVVSETYADLVASQGYTDKARALYEKLKLKFPKKSDYFAAKIENLEKS